MVKTKKAVVKKHPVAKVKKPVAKVAKPKLAKKTAAVKAAAKKIKPATILTTKLKKTVTALKQKPAPKIIPKEEIIAPKPVIKEIKIAVAPIVKKEALKVKIETPVIKKEIPLPVKPQEPKIVRPVIELKEVELKLPINVKDLSVKLQQKPSVLLRSLMDMRIMATINQVLDETLTSTLCEKFGFKVKKAADEEEIALIEHRAQDNPQDLASRSPIVTFMGHVDHGKTSLLDAIRKTKVADSEHGGITQHIGAYRVVLPAGEITFLDTPGHEAFTAMRAHGASITDIVVLVVAADDGLMPQTHEAIDHARAAGVPLIIAINKIDMPQANIDRVKKQLSEQNLLAEDWGGKTITVAVSAKTGEGIDNLLEMILLEAQMLELKANPKRLAQGVVLEAKLTKGRGPIVTLIVQKGTLTVGQNIVVGKYFGKIKAMLDDHGKMVKLASPSFPVEVSGITGVPDAGEQFYAIADEKIAKELVLRRQEKERQEKVGSIKRINLEDLYNQIKEGKLKELKLIIKVDVQGSLEAIKDTLTKMNTSEIKLEIIHEGVGGINSSDVVLAMASNALILGFHVTADDRAKEIAAKEGVDIRTYNIIYELGNDIKAALEGMLEPKLKKIFLGRAEVRKVFDLTRSGKVAGCFVSKGKILRTGMISLIRNGVVVFEGKLSALKRFKDDVREAAEGFECGISLANFQDIQQGDVIEAYDIEKIARKL